MMWYTILGNFAIITAGTFVSGASARLGDDSPRRPFEAALAAPPPNPPPPTFVRHTSTWLLMSPSSMATLQMGHRTVPGLSFLLEVPGVTVSAAGCLPPSLPSAVLIQQIHDLRPKFHRTVPVLPFDRTRVHVIISVPIVLVLAVILILDVFIFLVVVILGILGVVAPRRAPLARRSGRRHVGARRNPSRSIAFLSYRWVASRSRDRPLTPASKLLSIDRDASIGFARIVSPVGCHPRLALARLVASHAASAGWGRSRRRRRTWEVGGAAARVARLPIGRCARRGRRRPQPRARGWA